MLSGQTRYWQVSGDTNTYLFDVSHAVHSVLFDPYQLVQKEWQFSQVPVWVFP